MISNHDCIHKSSVGPLVVTRLSAKQNYELAAAKSISSRWSDLRTE